MGSRWLIAGEVGVEMMEFAAKNLAIMILLFGGGAGGFIVGYVWGIERERNRTTAVSGGQRGTR